MPSQPAEAPTHRAGFVVTRLKDWHLQMTSLRDGAKIDLGVTSSTTVVDISGARLSVDAIAPGSLVEITWKGDRVEAAVVERILGKAWGPRGH